MPLLSLCSNLIVELCCLSLSERDCGRMQESIWSHICKNIHLVLVWGAASFFWEFHGSFPYRSVAGLNMPIIWNSLISSWILKVMQSSFGPIYILKNVHQVLLWTVSFIFPKLHETFSYFKCCWFEHAIRRRAIMQWASCFHFHTLEFELRFSDWLVAQQ